MELQIKCSAINRHIANEIGKIGTQSSNTCGYKETPVGNTSEYVASATPNRAFGKKTASFLNSRSFPINATDKKLSVNAADKKLSVNAADKKLSVNAADKKLSVIAADKKLSVIAADKKLSVNAADKKLSEIWNLKTKLVECTLAPKTLQPDKTPISMQKLGKKRNNGLRPATKTGISAKPQFSFFPCTPCWAVPVPANPYDKDEKTNDPFKCWQTPVLCANGAFSRDEIKNRLLMNLSYQLGISQWASNPNQFSGLCNFNGATKTPNGLAASPAHCGHKNQECPLLIERPQGGTQPTPRSAVTTLAHLMGTDIVGDIKSADLQKVLFGGYWISHSHQSFADPHGATSFSLKIGNHTKVASGGESRADVGFVGAERQKKRAVTPVPKDEQDAEVPLQDAEQRSTASEDERGSADTPNSPIYRPETLVNDTEVHASYDIWAVLPFSFDHCGTNMKTFEGSRWATSPYTLPAQQLVAGH
jgi:hypothetical protein